MDTKSLLNSFQELLSYQTTRQLKLQAKAKQRFSEYNIANDWKPIHYGVNMLDNVIEEAIEAKRLVKARKWWSKAEAIKESQDQLYGNTELRHEFVEELADIFIQWLNCLVYFSVSPSEFISILEAKLEKNNPNNPKSDIGHRS